MTIPTVYPTLAATTLASNFTYLDTVTLHLGGGVLLITTWAIALMALSAYPKDQRIQSATFLTLILSLLMQAISLSYPQTTGILLAVLIISMIAQKLWPQYG